MANDHTSLSNKIRDLKARKNAVILAHYYQSPEIQDVADHVGDSLGLAQAAAKTNADIIVFAGVHFMAETAKILNPGKKVLLPDLQAGCSLADSCPPEQFREFISNYPGHTVVSYINCSAEIKAMSDLICTSANAVELINGLDPAVPVIFAPDVNLGRFVERRTGRKLVLWDGVCEVHQAFSRQKISDLRDKYPEAELVVHPESNAELLTWADFAGSTSAMINYIKKSPASTFIVATEAGILHQLKHEAPEKFCIPAPATENNTCACSECRFMKLNTLEKLYNCLRTETPEISLDEKIRQQALVPLQRMLEGQLKKNYARN